jgi:predicted DCC family thiol-disulfide oxidoreductase YuxK
LTKYRSLTNLPSGTPTVCIFDGDCGICQASVRLAGRLHARVDFIAFQSFDFAHAEAGLTLERSESEVLVVTPSGKVFGGAAAVAQILRVSWVAPLGVVLDSRLVLPVAGFIYRWVARNRSHLPQACGVSPAGESGRDSRVGNTGPHE